MNNVMTFSDKHKAVITYDPEIEMFRGEFLGLNGGADFYASNIEGLRAEGEASLKIFLEECTARGIAPRKSQGKFALRLDPETYQATSLAAASSGKSINQFITDAVRHAVEQHV